VQAGAACLSRAPRPGAYPQLLHHSAGQDPEEVTEPAGLLGIQASSDRVAFKIRPLGDPECLEHSAPLF
jgi:hypothetical protein